jgi:hypothetical protein
VVHARVLASVVGVCVGVCADASAGGAAEAACVCCCHCGCWPDYYYCCGSDCSVADVLWGWWWPRAQFYGGFDANLFVRVSVLGVEGVASNSRGGEVGEGEQSVEEQTARGWG